MKPKKPQKNGAAPRKRMPKWKRRLDEYSPEDLVKITFASEADIDAGTALVWGGRLTGLAFRLDPNSDSFIVPKASIPFFAEEGIQFTLHPAFRKASV
ncbi:MAG: hypothetical protein HYX68_00760 [Planctomycetes bacterium]|nr:hypothetical protein [Planctomycetota bacterium]